MHRWGRRAAATFAALLLAPACDRDQPPSAAEPSEAPGELQREQPDGGFSADARLDTVRMLEEDLHATRHPSDGGGRAWLESLESASGGAGVDRVRVGDRVRIRLGYEAQGEGIALGGVLFLQTSPFWGWDSPQTQREELPGYTTATALAEGVVLEPTTLPGQTVAFRVAGRALRAGERVEIVFGAGDAMAGVDRYAEAESRLWVHVDGDGDGVRATVAQTPHVRVVAGTPAGLIVSVPATAVPGERVRVRVALVDAAGNAGARARGSVQLAGPAGLELPARVALGEDGSARVDAIVREPGLYRLEAALELEATATAPARTLYGAGPPLVVHPDVQPVLWADLHGHSNLSDGTGTPEDFYRYARDTAGLDVAALTDHDHWGMRFLDAHPELWERIRAAARDAYTPGEFVSLLGFEWTSWLHGHRHVLYFDEPGASDEPRPLLSSLDPAIETPAQLWGALRGLPALTFAHHSAGGPISTNWAFAPDAVLEPVTEIVSVHGSSEAADSPAPIYDPVPGNTVRDVLDRGFVLGFVGSGDSHDGHPGLTHLASSGSGLAGIVASERTRAAVLEALRARRTYATNGPRIWLRVELDGLPMGSSLPSDGSAGHLLRFSVAATAPLERLDLVRSGRVEGTLPGDGRLEWSDAIEISPLEAGEYVYLRFVQSDGGAAWSSPFFATGANSGAP